MSESHSTLDRLEARIDHQAARIDELYRILEARGILVAPVETPAPAGDAFFDEFVQIEDAPFTRERNAGPTRRCRTPLRVGEATGV